jgi:RNA polymerase sigma-70 factor (ECF subfamily)
MLPTTTVTGEDAPGHADASTRDDDLARALHDAWPTLVRYLRATCPHDADVEDIAARTLEVGWRRRDELRRVEEAVPWLLAIARLTAANAQRGARRHGRLRARIAQVVGRSHEAGPHEALLAGEPGPATRALAAMSRTDREVLVLHVWAELDVAEIASVLDATPDAVAQRLSRARRRLRTIIEEADQ